MIKQKKHRLLSESYIGIIRCTFTLCVNNRAPLFTNKNIINKFNEILKDELKIQQIKNLIYIYMPDHLHLVLEGEDEKSDLLKAIKSFKQKSGYWLLKNKKECKWQKDFYDHIHRKEDDLKKHIIYILENPVRKGIVETWDEYEFKGSLDHEIEELLAVIP